MILIVPEEFFNALIPQLLEKPANGFFVIRPQILRIYAVLRALFLNGIDEALQCSFRVMYEVDAFTISPQSSSSNIMKSVKKSVFHLAS